MKLWGGRFETGPSEVFEQFSGSLHFDRKLIFADVEGSQAFARALERAGILTPSGMRQIVAAFAAISTKRSTRITSTARPMKTSTPLSFAS